MASPADTGGEDPQDDAAQRRRARLQVVVAGVLLTAWLIFLLAMALTG